MIRLLGTILLVLLAGIATVALGGAGIGEPELALIGFVVLALCGWLVWRYVRRPRHG